MILRAFRGGDLTWIWSRFFGVSAVWQTVFRWIHKSILQYPDEDHVEDSIRILVEENVDRRPSYSSVSFPNIIWNNPGDIRHEPSKHSGLISDSFEPMIEMVL
jgi:hypothetical protein